MTKESFMKIMTSAINYRNELDRWYDFGIDLFELPVAVLGWDMFGCQLELLFSEGEVDIINHYLFEIDCEEDSLDELWNIINKENND